MGTALLLPYHVLPHGWAICTTTSLLCHAAGATTRYTNLLLQSDWRAPKSPRMCHAPFYTDPLVAPMCAGASCAPFKIDLLWPKVMRSSQIAFT